MNIKDIVVETYSIIKETNRLNEKYKENKEEIQKFFDKKKIDYIEVEPNKEAVDNGITMVSCRKMEQLRIEYDAAKLKEKIDKELYNEIVSKQYIISDIDGLINLLKKSGISPKDFKNFLNVIETVNKEKIKQLYEVGDITKKQLDGCYTATLIKGIKMTERRKGGTN